jgi:DNA-binding response OmpR family regulator
MSVTPTRVLVAGVERHIVRLLRVNFERNGWLVSTALGGAQAIGSLKSQTFDRVVVDYDMPGVNGYDVLEFIRRSEAIKETWVCLLVKRSDDLEAIKALPYKADSYGPILPIRDGQND